MKNFAVINSDNEIVNLIICESVELAEELTGLNCIEYDIDEHLLDLNWSYDGENFIAPAPVEPTPLEDPIPSEEPDPEPGYTRP